MSENVVRTSDQRVYPTRTADRCSDCPPAGYPTEKTRCYGCPLANTYKDATGELVIPTATPSSKTVTNIPPTDIRYWRALCEYYEDRNGNLRAALSQCRLASGLAKAQIIDEALSFDGLPVETTDRQPTREAIDYAIETLVRYQAMSDPDCTCEPGQEKPCDGCRVASAIEGLRSAGEPRETSQNHPPTPSSQSKRDGSWIDEWGACKLCDGEIPDGHTAACDLWKLEQEVASLRLRASSARQGSQLEPTPSKPPDSRGDAALWVLAWLAMKGGLGSDVHDVIEAVMEGRAEMRPNNRLHIEPRSAENGSEEQT